ncbi:uncharacterized protein LOC117875318 [Trachemys scripta elegans]|uniref:uncharacterized protein LOC117875318 n=1 Tax=Trachemys scripta elegans TaxID=31138 RepID=UPI001554EA17|nr:uncharacterized protein LOC117875318 [Trachemys scripta elegans]
MTDVLLYLCGATHQAQTLAFPIVASLGVLAGSGSLDRVVTLPHPVFSSLQWLLNPQVVCAGVPFTAPQPSLLLVMDASALGWGAHLGDLRKQGLWSQAEVALHISVRELSAVRLACQTFCVHLTGRCLSVTTDNTVVMFFINKRGCTLLSPVQEALTLWDFCVAHSIHLQALDPRSTEQVGGQSQQVFSQPRVVPMPRCHELHIPKLGLSPDGLVHHATQQEVPTALLLPGSQPGLHCRRVLPPMGRPFSLNIPTHPSHSQGAPQDTEGRGLSDIVCSILALPTLVHISPGNICGSSSHLAAPPGLNNSGSWLSPAPEP